MIKKALPKITTIGTSPRSPKKSNIGYFDGFFGFLKTVAIAEATNSRHEGYHMHFATISFIWLCKNGTTINATVMAIPIIVINTFAEIFKIFNAKIFAIIIFIIAAFMTLIGCIGKSDMVGKGVWGMVLSVVVYAAVLYAPVILQSFVGWVAS